MLTVLLVIHLMIALALVGVVLLQRSEGGALGIGGGGGGGFMTGRGTANFLTRVTALLALGFFLSSIGLTLLARFDHNNRLTVDSIGKAAATIPANSTPPAAAVGSAAPTAPATATPASTPAAPAAVTPTADPAKKP